MSIVPRPPVGVAGLLLLPGKVFTPQLVLARGPRARVGGLPLLIESGAMKFAGAGQITRRFIGALRGECVVELRSVGPIDCGKFSIVVSVAVIRVSNEEWLILAGLVIIIAFALRQHLHDPVAAVVGSPDPRTGPLIIHRVIGRCV